MNYKILLTKQFSIDFKKLRDKKTKGKIKKKIEEVREDPLRYKRLHYELKGSFRIRIGVTIHVLEASRNQPPL